ncbi:MAG: peptidoglycan DD-metalloendopeptidase family protein [Cyclobacteriaceae bacterium]|nr:peptidoglycan DD-metalloendopeptidase family protein [Cyclobacteriaceae bacterium]
MRLSSKVVIATFILIFILAGYQIWIDQNQPESKPIAEVVLEDSVQNYEPVIFYGINIDSLEVVRNKIKSKQHLSDILTPYNVSKEDIYNLSLSAKGIFDLRKLRVNKPYDLLIKEDSLPQAKAMIYYHNDIDYVVFHMGDSIFVEKGAKEIVVKEQSTTGIINSSLSATISEMGLSPILTNELADVFAWQIDFFRLYPGDRFKVIYEEQLVEGKSIGISAIKAAIFEHNGYENFAYFYNQGTSIDYFDEEGKSLRKAFLKYPVQFSRISSRYSGSRYHPVQKRYKAHRGTDFAAPRGTPIRSVGEGTVVAAQYGKYNGNYVKIRHNSIYTTQYLHMSKIASGMKPGTHVKQGQTIGYVGATGLARGNHVCYRFWKSGYQVDALKVKLPSSEPIKEEMMEDFVHVAANLKEQLNAISYPIQKTTASIGGAK